jgi:hypothetical protein avisC_02045
MMKRENKHKISLALSAAKIAAPLAGYTAIAPVADLAQRAMTNLPEDTTTQTETHHNIIGEIKNQVPKWIRQQKDQFQSNGINTSGLEIIKTEALSYVRELERGYQLLSKAIQDPERFQSEWKQRSAEQAENIDEELAPYFEGIVDRILSKYMESACESVYWRLEMATKLSNDQVKLKREFEQALENFRRQITQAIESQLPTNDHLTKRLHTPHPQQAHNYIKRTIDDILNEYILDAKQYQTALIGMTGTGKTQLAVTLATACENRGWRLVAWMDGSSRSTIKSGLVELARAMRVDTKDEPTEKQIIARLFTELKSRNWDDRLIIFDNVDDITDLTDLTPDAPGLRVIATTTNSIGWEQQSWQTINVETFSRKDAIQYLLSITQSNDKVTAGLIATKLGDLPLALAQAAATALNENWSLEQYFARLEKYSSDDVILSYPGDSYTNEVSFALLLAKESAINKLKEDVRKEADKIIYILTLLAASGVPTQWLDPFHNNSEISTTSDANAINKHHALNALIHNSIIQQSKDTNITTIHRFQAQVIRECWSSTERNTALDTAARLLNNIISKTAKNLPATSQQHEVLTLIQQIQAISNQKHSQDIFHHANIQDTLSEIFHVVKVLGIAYAATSLDTAVSLTSQHFGNTQPSTILCQIGLGDAFANSGDTTTALEILEDAYLRSKDHLGEDNWVTLSGNIVRATTYAKKERFRKAIELAEDTYSRYVSQFSETDPQTFSTRNSLAQIYLQAGNASQAINHCLALLNSLADTNSQDLDFILTVLNNLAAAYQQDEQVSDAIEVFEYICNQPISVHKNGYHDYYICKCNLAAAYRQDHQPARAISILEQICEESKQTIGSYHSDRFHFRTLLAKWYLEDRDFTNAVKVLKTLHEDSGRTFANDSKNTLEYEHMLAFAYAEQGDFHSALPFIEHAYNSRLSTLGASDTATLESKYNFAFTLLRLNDWDRAIPLLVEALNDPHMNTDQLTDTQLNLAYAYHMQNDFTAALKTYLLARKTCQQDPDAYAEKLNYANQQISSLRAILHQTE